jgi:hypothetical protein
MNTLGAPKSWKLLLAICVSLLAPLCAVAWSVRLNESNAGATAANAGNRRQDSGVAGAGRSWVESNFPAAFDRFFSIKGAEGDFIAIRAHRDHTNDLPEFLFVLQNTQNPKAISAVLREAQGHSLFEQLSMLHAKDSAKPLASLESELQVSVWKLSAAQCPAIGAQYAAFENIQFVRPHDDDAVDEHPIVYEVNESVGGGESQVVEFVESRALPRWANQTRKLLDACAAAAPAEDHVTP